MRESIAVDFDGTIAYTDFPDILGPIPGAFNTLQELRKAGYAIILWTCREDHVANPDEDYLTQAIGFCVAHGFEFDAINGSITDRHEIFNPKDYKRVRKAYADHYIDDHNFGGFPGWEVVAAYFGVPYSTDEETKKRALGAKPRHRKAH